MQQIKRYWPYVLLGFIILGPLLLPGYILTMDMVFVPHPPLPTEVNASYPFYALLHVLSYIVPGDILQKVILLAILSLAGIGMHRLIEHELPGVSRWVLYAASIFYTVNPFTYERLMMGQFAVIAGYALLPFLIVSFHRFLHRLSWTQLARSLGWLVAISIMSIHSLLPALILLFCIWVVALWQQRGTRFWHLSLRKLGLGGLAFLGVSSYWLIPVLLGSNAAATALREMASAAAFATQGNIFTVLRLEGFWAEGRGLFAPAHISATVPVLWQLAVWISLVAGVIISWYRQRKVFLIYMSVLVIGAVLAFVGVPFLGEAYREPHKFVMLVALALTVLAAVGADALVKRFRYAGPAMIAVPLLLSPVMLWGFSGQLTARQYPPEWLALNQKLRGLPDDKPAIFLPWHLYQRYSFSPRIVANPAATYFDHKVLVNNDPEIEGIRPLKIDTSKALITSLLNTHASITVSELRRLGVGYVIFADEPGREDVEFLRNRPGMQLLFRQGSLELYQLRGGSS